jgi:hypothetical protein
MVQVLECPVHIVVHVRNATAYNLTNPLKTLLPLDFLVGLALQYRLSLPSGQGGFSVPKKWFTG